MKKLLLISLFFSFQFVFGQIETKTFEEVDRLLVSNPRPVIVFIHTNWCKYCKIMEKSTFKSKEIIEKLNDSFYFVKLNAEEKNNITFNNSIFKYVPNGVNTGIHQLAEQLATIDQEVAYPTICILNSKHEIVFQHNKLLNTANMLTVLQRI